MQGKIIKGIAGFYYVHLVKAGVYECKAKGIFRKEKIKPLVGDDVEIDILSDTEKTGNICKILNRKNELIRPAVANVDQVMVIFSANKPSPNFNLLDRFLAMMEYQQVETIICFNKQDLASAAEQHELHNIYKNCGCRIVFTSAKQKSGLKEVQDILEGKTTTVAGPSGVGKSSLINILQPEVEMETGAISEKIQRGKHTTRHSQLIYIREHTYIMDTPGFSSMFMLKIEKEELKDYFNEFRDYEQYCRFLGCSHINEPDCGVKQALLDGKISSVRYENYLLMHEEIKNHKKY